MLACPSFFKVWPRYFVYLPVRLRQESNEPYLALESQSWLLRTLDPDEVAEPLDKLMMTLDDGALLSTFKNAGMVLADRSDPRAADVQKQAASLRQSRAERIQDAAMEQAFWPAHKMIFEEMLKMKITRVSVFRVDLPVRDGGFIQSSGRVWRTLDTSIVKMETDVGLTGWGETTPFGSNYLPAFAQGARAGIGVVAPKLLGMDPRALGQINLKMDTVMYGNPYVKTGLDIACWDIAAQSAGVPVYMLLGGRLTDPFRTAAASRSAQARKKPNSCARCRLTGSRNSNSRLAATRPPIPR